jgi:thermitase
MARRTSIRCGGTAGLAIAACALASFLAGSQASAAPSGGHLSALDPGGSRAYFPGEAIVHFEPGTSAADRRAARNAAGVEFEESLAIPRTQLVQAEGSISAAVRRLQEQPGVADAQPNYRYQAAAVPPPSDTFFASLWGLSDPALPDPGVGALEAWEQSEGDGEVIAVLDTGVDLTHPDLAGNLWTNPDPAPSVDDLHGYDFVDDDGDPDDYNFHGTHVAGTAAAIADNGLGIAGVAPAGQIMAIRVLDGDGSGSTADIADGVAYAAEHGAGVINLSLGGPAGEDEAMEDAVELAGADGAVVVVAAGNDGENNDAVPTTPCTLPQANLICVAAINKSGALASFSNYGAKSVDIAAPGTSILSAKVDYGAPLFSNGFEPGTTGAWLTSAENGGIEWGLATPGAGGSTQAAADSPDGAYGQAVNPSEFAVSEMFTDDAVDLSGERGCRIHFLTKYELEEGFDFLLAGAIDEGSSFDLASFTGASFGYPTGFEREEASISGLDGEKDAHPLFAVLSDQAVEADGAYVDDVRLICRDETYLDQITSASQYDQPSAGNYVAFQGTSMATPHVAGVVALVRAAAPGASATQVVDAILTGAAALPVVDAARPIASFGIADACQAIAVAREEDFVEECPGSTENEIPPGFSLKGIEERIVAANSAGPSSGLRDLTAPRTSILRHPGKIVRTRTSAARVVFRFASNEPGVAFACRIDGGPFRLCRARLVRRFGLGPHAVKVLARDEAGNRDPTPASFRFRVERIESDS